MQYTGFSPETRKPPTIRCARCPAMVPVAAAIVTEWLDPDDRTWYPEYLCTGCADPADLLLDRLIREDAARVAR